MRGYTQRRLVITEVPSIEPRRRGYQHTLVARKRHADRLHVRPAPERLFKALDVVIEATDAFDDNADRHVTHLVTGKQRPPDLVLETDFTTVVEEPLEVSRVVDGRRVSANTLAFNTDRQAQLVLREALLGDMAHRAGHRIVRGEPPIEKQLAAELHLVATDRIVVRHGNRRQPEWRRIQHRQQVGIVAATRLQAGRTSLEIGTFVTLPNITGALARLLAHYRACNQQQDQPAQGTCIGH